MTMLPVPTADQVRGLSAPDLVICLSSYAAAEGYPCFYRNRLWLEWHDVEHLSCKEIAARWTALPRDTREWIAPNYHAAAAYPTIIVEAIVDLRKRLGFRAPSRSALYSLHHLKVRSQPISVQQAAKALGIGPTTLYNRLSSKLTRGGKAANGFDWEFDFRELKHDFYVRPVGRGPDYWRNILWWNWHHAEAIPTYANPWAIAQRSNALPDQVRR